MAITPTVMIAAQGMLSGQGIGINPDMVSKMTQATSNPITGGVTALQAQATALSGTDPDSAAAITSALSGLPSAFTNVSSTVTAATSQANSMVPSIKGFIGLHSSSTAFGSASMEYGAALAQFGNKSFGDLGVGVKSFVDANSGGLTSLVPGLGALAAKAKTDAFGGLGSNLDPAALLKGTANMASSALGDGLKSVGQGINNFGKLFDFKNPQKLGYQSLVKNLQEQGLSGSVGIDDGIANHGYDPAKLSAVPDSVLKDVLTGITGNDLQKIITQTGVKPSGTVKTAADLIDPSIIMPASATAALGIKPGSGLVGLKSLGNTFTNIGVPMDGANAAKLLNGVQSKVGGYLSGLTTLVPASVSASLKPFLGSGSTPFGTPSMSDMLGSVGGKHTEDFTSATKQLTSVAGSSQGQSLSSAMNGVMAAISSGSGLETALARLSSASSSFSSQAISNASLSGALSSINGSMSKVTSHLSLETTNLGLAGMTLGSLPTPLGGSTQILAFASKLHSFGVDKLQLGHNDVMNGVAGTGLAGDAIKAALLEGKNVVAMAAAGKSAPSVSNVTKALSESNAENIDTFIASYDKAQSEKQVANGALEAAKSNFKQIDNLYQANPDSDGLRAQWSDLKGKWAEALNDYSMASDKVRSERDKMNTAAESGGSAAMRKATAAMEKYLA